MEAPDQPPPVPGNVRVVAEVVSVAKVDSLAGYLYRHTERPVCVPE